MSQAENKKELPSKYNPHGLENKWYPVWEGQNFFSYERAAQKDHLKKGELSQEKIEQLKKEGRVFSIVIPPPNVTGSLHLGHALNHTIQDILTRYHRMKGDYTLWVPGTDHAGIATQNVVERLLAKEGKKRWEMSREDFEKRVWEWKAESGGMITHQQRELGESVDWGYERFTLDDGLSLAVRKVFARLYNQGLIYRGERIINWCPHDVTALSNIEVEYKERKGKLYYIHYKLADGSGQVTVATTRPETMLGDEALAVNPGDERYKTLIGKKVVLPLLNKEIPVIADDYVDSEYGTGIVKITPAHDPNDFEVGARHKLPITRVMDDHGRMNELAGPYNGLSREECRKKVLEDLEQEELLEKTEDMKHAVGECYRCGTIVEPITSLQWFVKIQPLAERAIEVVKNGSVEFIPQRWQNTYFDWMYKINDWCISRQLWWGHRIPAFYCDDCGHVMVSETDPDTCEKCGSKNIRQDEDVLDTWFSSGLWPFSTLMQNKEGDEPADWRVSSEEIQLFYPTSVLVTGFDIIFFWVARMIMMGEHFMKEVPFRKVYIHGLVRDATRQKMSKSKGNVVNPLEKMKEYGTDAFRFFMMSILPEGSDIIYDESRLKGYQAFCNKIWNTARYIWMNQPADYIRPYKMPGTPNSLDKWLIREFNLTLKKATEAIENYRFADYAQAVYDFIWKSFCDNYIELSKISLKNHEHAETTRFLLNQVFENSLKLLHPVMPFITEELYSFWPRESKDDLIIISQWPEPLNQELDVTDVDYGHLHTQQLMHLVYRIRNMRGELGLPPSDKFNAIVTVEDEDIGKNIERHKDYVQTLAKLSGVTVLQTNEKQQGVRAVLDFGLVYLDVADKIDLDKERARIEKEIEKVQKGLNSLAKKLNNDQFLERAPDDLVEAEKARAGELQTKMDELKALKNSLD